MMLQARSLAALPAIRHAFFTREGGVSQGVYASLNAGVGSNDDQGLVEENRARMAGALGVAPEHLLSVYQIHSPDVVVAEEPWPAGARPRADAIVTRQPGLAIAASTADCGPVLFADPEAGVIGAAHAGWRGALAGVLESTLDAMEALGARRADIAAVIGPTISQRAYEVGPEFMDAFLAEDPGYDRFFAGGTGDRVMFDLPGFGLHRLRAAGVGHAEWTGHCTYSDPERFFSYRRSIHRGEADYGRLISAIRV